MSSRSRIPLSVAAFLTIALALCLCCACSSGGNGGGQKPTPDEPVSVRIGTLATEDILPYWAAERDGIFEKNGIDAEIVQFQSATELIAGVSAGEVDLAMTDPMVSASLYASGTDLRVAWITLGTTPDQGRFGIMTASSSGITSLSQLADTPIGVGSNTILEYVMDTLLAREGITPEHILKEEIQKLPIRYQQMEAGTVAAAALPASLLALGEANGCVLIADDTAGENISQSIMIVRTAWATENPDAMPALEAAWDEAAAAINADPNAYRELLVQKANLSDKVADTYPICTYPTCELPTNQMIDPVLAWMQTKGYLTVPLTYDEQTGAFAKA